MAEHDEVLGHAFRGTPEFAWSTAASSPQGPEPGLDVHEVGIVGGHEAEQLSCPRQVAGPLVEVGQGVGDAQVVELGPLGRLAAGGQEVDGLLQPALVGEGPGGDDACFGHQLGAGAGGAQLRPQLLDLVVPPEGPVGVGQHRMLLGRAGLGAERLQLAAGLCPAPEPVQREPVQLPHRRGPGRLFGQGPEDAAGVLVALAAEGVAGLVQALLEPGDAVGGHHPAQLVLCRGPFGPAAPGPGPDPALAAVPPATARCRRRCRFRARTAAPDGPGGLVPELAFVDPLLRLPGRLAFAAGTLAFAAGPLALPVTAGPGGPPGIRRRSSPPRPPPRHPAPPPRPAHLPVVVPVGGLVPVPVGPVRRPGRAPPRSPTRPRSPIRPRPRRSGSRAIRPGTTCARGATSPGGAACARGSAPRPGTPGTAGTASTPASPGATRRTARAGGAVGATGRTAGTGAAGAAGTASGAGAAGAVGTAGAAGAAGTACGAGAAGAVGTAGAAGAAGTACGAGAAGAVGTAGAAGAAGTASGAGAVGTAGAAGAPGTACGARAVGA